jgi:phosphohistidine phosphatase SixA
VRHAERADQSSDSALSPTGVARAERLARMLKDAGITHLFTSEFRRTRDTAVPLAGMVHMKTEQLPAGNTQALVEKVSALGAHDRVLIVGHSNTVPEILRLLHVAQPLTIADEEYDNLFVVVPHATAAPTLLRLKY